MTTTDWTNLAPIKGALGYSAEEERGLLLELDPGIRALSKSYETTESIRSNLVRMESGMLSQNLQYGLAVYEMKGTEPSA